MDGTSVVTVSMLFLLVEWLGRIGGVNVGWTVVVSSSSYRMVMLLSVDDNSGSCGGIGACLALRRCPSDVW